MVRVEDAVRAFREGGIRFFTGVPDSLLKDICAYITESSGKGEHIIAANEGSAVALALGHYLATGAPALVYLQNSGLGNAVNPFLSLADPDVYGIPMVVMVGWRGEPGRKDEPQHVKQGRVMLPLLDAIDYPYFVLDGETHAPLDVIASCCHTARKRHTPAVLAVRANTFGTHALQSDGADTLPLDRERAISLILARLDERAVVVSTTGKASREVFEERARTGQGHHRDFLTVGGMGHASMIALGIALRHTARPVVCLDGDGAALMHLGAMTTIGTEAAPNFKHILINNGSHDSVGGQPTVGFHVDFLGLARSSGYRRADSAETPEDLTRCLDRLLAVEGPALLEVRVRKGARPDLGRPTTQPVDNKRAFMQWLGIVPEVAVPE